MEDRLRKFATLVDAGSFTRASAALHISQPALTVAINKLERELDVALLTRGSRSFEITSAGKAAYKAAQEVSATIINLRVQLQELEGQLPHVRIGMIDSIAAQFLADDSLSSHLYAAMEISLVVNNSTYLLRAVRRGELDVACVTGQLVIERDDDITVEAVGSEPMPLVSMAQDRIETERLLNHRQPSSFISYDQQSHSHDLIKQQLAQKGIHTQEIFYSSSPDAMLQLVLKRKGVAVLPYALVERHVLSSKLAIVRHPRPVIIERPMSIITRSNRQLPQALLDLPRGIERLLSIQREQVR